MPNVMNLTPENAGKAQIHTSYPLYQFMRYRYRLRNLVFGISHNS